jgi:hypothetical protein
MTLFVRSNFNRRGEYNRLPTSYGGAPSSALEVRALTQMIESGETSLRQVSSFRSLFKDSRLWSLECARPAALPVPIATAIMGNESRLRMVNSVCTFPCRGCLRLTKRPLLVFADCRRARVPDWQSCLTRQTNLLDRKRLSYLCCVLLTVAEHSNGACRFDHV